MAPLDDLTFPSSSNEDGLARALAAAASAGGATTTADAGPSSAGPFGNSTSSEGIFMSAKTMASEDVFARLAALTSPDPNAENIVPAPSPTRNSRIRARRSDGDEDDEGSALGKGFGSGLGLGYASSVGGSGISTVTTSVPPSSPGSPGKRPRKRARVDVGDRFVPTKEIDERQRAFHLLDDDERMLHSSHRIIPFESDAAREQANMTFSSMLSRELADDDETPIVRPATPVRTSGITTPLALSTALPSSAASVSSSTSGAPTTPTRKRVFTFQTPPRSTTPLPLPLGHDTPLASAYATSPIKASTSTFLTSPQRQLRSVCKTPFRVLDAPELTDDFYLNLVDWSTTNVLGVGLGSAVYLWSAKTAQVTKLCDLQASNDAITSLSWVQRGSVLAVGTFNGGVEVWDAVRNVRIRRYDGHAHRVGALAWNESTVSSGSRDRKICHWDVRERGKRPYATLLAHRQEVCGLKWGGGTGVRQLASGGNDNKLMIWDARGSGVGAHGGNANPGVNGGLANGDAGAGVVPVWKWHEHSAAVKAIAWNPHVPGVLVSGGGTQDKKMRFWNTMVGSMLAEVDTGSQVCNLTWSKTSQELVSTHGYSSTSGSNLICIWKYPSMDMVATLSGHTARVLYLAMSPDGQTIVTGAGDETLRFWNAFPRKRGGEARPASAVTSWGSIR